MHINKSLAFSLLLLASAAQAKTRIAVLDFELNDITSLPNTSAELTRTASMAPLLLEALGRAGDVQAVPVSPDLQNHANGGFGYLFRYPDEAAKLGRQVGADLLVVSQHSKPSFLYSELWVYLVDVKTQQQLARYDIQLKGNHENVTRHGIQALAEKIQVTLDARPNR
ncbi:DUF2380 domain-containing protein [Methylomonas sp. MgM2]